jgi:hypothetical protein
MCFLWIRLQTKLYRTESNQRFRVEAGSNTLTVAQRVVGGDEKGTTAWGYNRATLFLGDITAGAWPSRLGVSKLRQQNVVMSPTGL